MRGMALTNLPLPRSSILVQSHLEVSGFRFRISFFFDSSQFSELSTDWEYSGHQNYFKILGTEVSFSKFNHMTSNFLGHLVQRHGLVKPDLKILLRLH